MLGETEAIGAATGMLDIFARVAQQKQQNIQNFLNTAQQNQLNLSLYREQREFNKPANQRKMLEEAGYNPNLLYGHGVVAASSPPTMEKPEYRAPDISGWQQVRLNDVNIQAIEANKEVAIAQAREVNAKADIAEHDRNIINSQDFTTSTDPFLPKAVDRAREEAKKIPLSITPTAEPSEPSGYQRKWEKNLNERQKTRYRRPHGSTEKSPGVESRYY